MTTPSVCPELLPIIDGILRTAEAIIVSGAVRLNSTTVFMSANVLDLAFIDSTSVSSHRFLTFTSHTGSELSFDCLTALDVPN